MRVIVSLIYLQMVVLTSTPAAYAQEGELDNNTRLALANFVAEMVECSVYYAINGQLQDGFGTQWKMGKDYQKLSENMGLAAFALAKTIKMKITNYELEDVKSWDYPDFCDAFISYAEDENGKEMTEEQIQEWTENNEEEFYEMIQESLR